MMAHKPIKLFVDAHSFDAGFQGTQTFIRELYTSLMDCYPDLDIYWGVQNANTISTLFPSVKPENILIYKNRYASILRFVFDIPRFIKKHQFDFAHFQYMAPQKSRGCGYIVTSHDVLFNDFPSYFPFSYRIIRNLLFGRSIKTADFKTTVSAYSKERLAKNYDIPVHSITIIPNGVGKPLFTRENAKGIIKTKFGISNFILYVSRIEPRKNHAMFLNKWLKLRLYKQNIPLVFIGKNSIPDARLQSAIRKLNPEQKALFHWFPQMAYEDLQAFYAACTLFVYPSKAEGFGIPPLEAAICGVPVLCSSATAMSKFDFFKPHTFDPNDEKDFELKLKHILSQPPSEDYLKNIAATISQTYTWQKSARLFYNLLSGSLSRSQQIVPFSAIDGQGMKVAIIARSTLYSVPGGDTVQAIQTARHLTLLGIKAEIHLSNEPIAYDQYDLLHFFNIIRPADILYHSKKSGKPFVVSTILCDYSEYDKYHRKGTGLLFGKLTADNIEYIKTMARWLLNKDHLSSFSYVWKGQRKSIIEILRRSAMVLPNSESEYQRLAQNYTAKLKHLVIPNGANPQLFQYNPVLLKDPYLVLCVARIEGIKNQITLIKALNNTPYRLLIIGSNAPNQAGYYHQCRNLAANNITFIDHVEQKQLVKYYQMAKVHVLPSWFETTGLSSIEAALMGCNIVITDKGDTVEYFADDAFYCDPGNPKSILASIEKAAAAPFNQNLQQRILKNYTWEQAAVQTLKAYQLAATA